MRTRRLLAATGLILALSACATAPPEADINTSQQDEATPAAVPDVAKPSSSSTAAISKELPNSPVEMENCTVTQYVSKPLARTENEAVFDPFNFRASAVTIYADTLAIETTDYTFYYCSGDKAWVTVSNDTESKPSDERGYDLDKIANPAYQSIEVNGEIYEYRTRLKANWLTKRGAVVKGAPEEDTQDGEDTVYFDLTLPNGDQVSRELYTVSDLQTAKLGASLGIPDISGAASVDGAIWFAATASQGEGDNGFASLLKYDLEAKALSVEQPEEIQGDQLTDLVATEQGGEVTLWLGTQRMSEGVPFFPAKGLVAYQPESGKLKTYTITNSPLVGAIPHALALKDDQLWVATGDGTCQVRWQRIETAESWDCWRLTARAQLPKGGVDIYSSSLASAPKAKLTKSEVEVLWAAESEDRAENELDTPQATRYEVVYEPGFETVLSQGGYQVADAAAKRAAQGEAIFWPGRQWHWAGDRFRRGLDEVGLNLVGGGPYGLVSSTARSGLGFDQNAIRGAFDLLELTPEGTKVRYYSGWVDANAIEVYPKLEPTAQPKKMKQNPLTEMANDLPNSGP